MQLLQDIRVEEVPMARCPEQAFGRGRRFTVTLRMFPAHKLPRGLDLKLSEVSPPCLASLDGRAWLSFAEHGAQGQLAAMQAVRPSRAEHMYGFAG